MAGHSRWHNIRIKKERMDRERGKLFSKLTREIIVAAREGGSNPETNLRLRGAIERAREAGMPNENIQRAIARGSGSAGGEHYEEVTYEGYGPGGVAILVRAATDNRNRTAAEVRSVFHRMGGTLAEAGAVAWMFDRKGLIQIDRNQVSEDTLLLVALEAGAEDVRVDDGTYEVLTAPEDLGRVREALQQAGIRMSRAEVTLVPKSTVPLAGPDAERVLRLVDALDDLDDVQEVYANFDVPEELLQRVG